MALTHQIRPFPTLVLVFVTNKNANTEMPCLQNVPGNIFTKLSVENREMSKTGTMFDLVYHLFWLYHTVSLLTSLLSIKIYT